MVEEDGHAERQTDAPIMRSYLNEYKYDPNEVYY